MAAPGLSPSANLGDLRPLPEYENLACLSFLLLPLNTAIKRGLKLGRNFAKLMEPHTTSTRGSGAEEREK